MDAWLTALLQTIAAIGAWRYVLAFVGIFCETSLFVGLIVPGDTIVLATATANRGWFEWAALLATVIIGSLGGESLGFAIGRFFGPKLRRSRLGVRIGERNWQRSERWIERRGGFAIFLSRFLPVLHALVPVTTGMSEYPFRRFLSWTAPACALWAAVYVSVGTVAGSSYRALAGELRGAAWIFFAVIAVFLVGAALGRRALERFERRSHRS